MTSQQGLTDYLFRRPESTFVPVGQPRKRPSGPQFAFLQNMGQIAGRSYWLPNLGSDEDIEITVQADVTDLENLVVSLNVKVAELQSAVEQQTKLLLAISQAYYWTPEWQEKERRAEAELQAGGGQVFDSAEALIQYLRSPK